MEKFNVEDLVFISSASKLEICYKEEIARKINKQNRKIYLKNWDKTGLPTLDVIYKLIYIYEDYGVIENELSKYYIVNLESLNKVPKENDRIVFLSEEKPFWKGLKGVVREVNKEYKIVGNEFTKYKCVGVEFEESMEGMHRLNGDLKEEKGWYCNYIDFKYDYEEPEKKAIVIEDDVDNVKSEDVNNLVKEVAKLTKEIHKKERMQDILNEAIIEKGKDIAVEDLKDKLKNDLDNFIQEKYGILPKKIEVSTPKSTKTMTGIFHKKFEKIVSIVNADIPLMLVGPAGAGKNHTLEQVAEALGLEFYFSNAVNQEYKLTGFIDANGTYHETEFYKAYTKGGMFFLDEIDASSPESLVILNSAIANKYFDFPVGRIKANENFRIVCAGNTYGTGADMIYVGRNVLDGATLDRFVVLPFEYDEEVEKQLAYDEDLFNFIKALRNAVDEANLRYIISMRAIINATKLLNIGVSKREILETSIIKNMQIDDLNTIVNKIKYQSEWTTELKGMSDNVGNR